MLGTSLGTKDIAMNKNRQTSKQKYPLPPWAYIQ